jgi:hypothetical protein
MNKNPPQEGRHRDFNKLKISPLWSGRRRGGNEARPSFHNSIIKHDLRISDGKEKSTASKK